ncbi:MAG: hypothetical protein HYT46_01145 [Candidatus Vogelbacteria bacterium]|nr:hypothetical protein [Candidatus Vogelbacteria bacterium]
MSEQIGRVIGIKHRVKKTVAGESRPTMVAIICGDQVTELKLATEDDEIDFILEGLRRGDTVAMPLGGSGNYLAYAIARQLEKLGDGRLIRLKPHLLKERRGGAEKGDDHLLLARLAGAYAEIFTGTTVDDLALIELKIAFRIRQDAVKARVACELRLFQRTVGEVFVREGLSPESSIEKRYLAAKATDQILQVLLKEEAARNRELETAVKKLAVWQNLFAPLEGVGPRIAAPIIVAVGDIRLFPSDRKRGLPAFKRFCGVGCASDGAFLRRRKGEKLNLNPEIRQALYLLADQWNRRPDSVWGKKLRESKAYYRRQYPQKVQMGRTDPENGASKLVWRYTDGHIHKMAIWRTLTKFAEWLFLEWRKLAREAEVVAV